MLLDVIMLLLLIKMLFPNLQIVNSVLRFTCGLVGFAVRLIVLLLLLRWILH